jgi:hypothetical protein
MERELMGYFWPEVTTDSCSWYKVQQMKIDRLQGESICREEINPFTNWRGSMFESR